MMVKAQLTAKLGEIIAERQWSQQQAATVIGLTQPKLSQMLRGQFRGISETKMLDALARLELDVPIVIGPTRTDTTRKHVGIAFVASPNFDSC